MTLVLVHGLSGSPRWWHAVLPLLSDRDTRLMDVPRRIAPSAAAPWLAAQLDAPVDLVGHSLGGLTCARVAAERPELVRTLTLVDPVGAPPNLPSHNLLVAHYARGLAATLLRAPLALTRTVVADAVRTGPVALARGAIAAMFDRFDGTIVAPTLLVWGERDALVPVALAEEWRRCVPDARLEVIPSAGHVPMIEAPSLFAEALNRFLDGAHV